MLEICTCYFQGSLYYGCLNVCYFRGFGSSAQFVPVSVIFLFVIVILWIWLHSQKLSLWSSWIRVWPPLHWSDVFLTCCSSCCSLDSEIDAVRVLRLVVVDGCSIWVIRNAVWFLLKVNGLVRCGKLKRLLRYAALFVGTFNSIARIELLDQIGNCFIGLAMVNLADCDFKVTIGVEMRKL